MLPASSIVKLLSDAIVYLAACDSLVLGIDEERICENWDWGGRHEGRSLFGASLFRLLQSKIYFTSMEMDAAAPTPDLEPGLEMVQFSDECNDSTFHFQILRLVDQLYVWIGCNSARIGNLYAALPTRWDRTASVAALIGGGAESTGASMARRLSMRTGWSIILASNIPSNAPVLEAFAEKRLFQELRTLGYVKPASKASNGAVASLTPI